MAVHYSRRISLRNLIASTAVFLLIILYHQRSFLTISVQRCLEGATCSELLLEVQNETLGFQRVFVLNLAYRTDHRDSLTLAAAVSGLDLTFVDGVDGSRIANKSLPVGADSISAGEKGCWRAHMNVLQRIVDENISTALILEDDADWDFRLKSLLPGFALATQILTQPLSGDVAFLDPTFPTPKDNSLPQEFYLNSASLITPPSHSPYGDNWELLWLGHCGARFPGIERSPKAPRGRVLIHNDPTVAQTQYYDKGWGSDELIQTYPNHTRAVHHAGENTCTLAYAVTQASARRLLYHAGLKDLTDPIDLTLWKYCDGVDDRKMRSCLTPNPTLFGHFRPKGSTLRFSDTRNSDEGMNERDYSTNIRMSTRVNLEKLVEGDHDLIDQYPDT